MASEQDLLKDLSAPVKSFRLFALEQAINTGASSELLQALEKHHRDETDDECLHLLPHAIDAVRSRLSGQPAVADEGLTAQTFPVRYSQTASPQRLRLLLAIPRPMIPSLVDWAVEEFPRTGDSILKGKLLSLFGRHWPADRLELLLDRIFDPSVSVRVGAIEALIALAPERLVPHFSALLTEEDPRVMMTAIKGLARIDEEETAAYIEHVLLGKRPLRKLAMLRAATGLPFHLVKGPLLKFLALESDPDLLQNAGLVFHLNPDREVPYRLLEVMSQADSKRIPILRETFEGALGIIRNSNHLGGDFPAFVARLEETARRQDLLRSVYNAALMLESEDEQVKDEGRRFLAGKKLDPYLPAILGKLATLGISQSQRGSIEAILSAPDPVTPPPLVEEEAFESRTPTEQCRWLAGLPREPGEKALACISRVLREERADAKVQAVALKTALRLEIDGYRDLARKWVHRSDEPLVVAGLEYLARFDMNGLIPLLGMFHTADNPRVRILAMQILWRQDPEQAMSSILLVLKHSNQRSRTLAFAALMAFDFSLIRESLVESLITSRDQEILEPILLLFQNNPAPENLFLLYKLEAAFPAPVAEKIRRVRTENTSLVETLKLVSQSELKLLQDSFPMKLQALQARRAAPPVYALKKGMGSHRELFSWRSSLTESANELSIIALLGLLIFGAAWIGVGAMAGQGAARGIVSGALYSGPVEIEGTVKGWENDGKDVVIATADQTVFQLRIPRGLQTFSPGQKVRAVIKPHRKGEGVIYARFQTLLR